MCGSGVRVRVRAALLLNFPGQVLVNKMTTKEHTPETRLNLTFVSQRCHLPTTLDPNFDFCVVERNLVLPHTMEANEQPNPWKISEKRCVIARKDVEVTERALSYLGDVIHSNMFMGTSKEFPPELYSKVCGRIHHTKETTCWDGSFWFSGQVSDMCKTIFKKYVSTFVMPRIESQMTSGDVVSKFVEEWKFYRKFAKLITKCVRPVVFLDPSKKDIVPSEVLACENFFDNVVGGDSKVFGALVDIRNSDDVADYECLLAEAEKCVLEMKEPSSCNEWDKRGDTKTDQAKEICAKIALFSDMYHRTYMADVKTILRARVSFEWGHGVGPFMTFMRGTLRIQTGRPTSTPQTDMDVMSMLMSTGLEEAMSTDALMEDPNTFTEVYGLVTLYEQGFKKYQDKCATCPANLKNPDDIITVLSEKVFIWWQNVFKKIVHGHSADQEDCAVHVLSKISEWLGMCAKGNFSTCIKDGFVKAMKATFREWEDISTVLAFYCDTTSKKNGSNLPSTIGDLTGFYEALGFAYQHLPDKDVFLEYYRRLMANRLLQKEESKDVEQGMLGIIKQRSLLETVACSRLEGMNQDIIMSEVLSEQFTQWQKNAAPPSGPNTAIKVGKVFMLTQNRWPAQKTASVYAGQAADTAMKQFETFFGTRHEHHTISWVPSMTSVRLECKKFPKRVNVLATMYHAAILDVFNNRGCASIDEIVDITGIPRGEIVTDTWEMGRWMKPLVIRFKFLVPYTFPDGRRGFTVNTRMRSKSMNIKLTGVPKVVAQNVKDSQTVVNEDRSDLTDSAIVRAMKTRNRMSHGDLVSEVTKLCIGVFSPQPMHIKRRIEHLIEKEFIERDPNDVNVYVYVA